MCRSAQALTRTRPLLPRQRAVAARWAWASRDTDIAEASPFASTPWKSALKTFPTAPCPSSSLRFSKAEVVGRGGGRANAGRIKIETSQIKWTLAPKRNKKPRSQEKKA